MTIAGKRRSCGILTLIIIGLPSPGLVGASSHDRRRYSSVSRRKCNSYPLLEDGSSSYRSSSSVDEPLDDEERILNALAQIEESEDDMPGTSYRPTAREIALHENTQYRKGKAKRKTHSRTRRRKISRRIHDDETMPASREPSTQTVVQIPNKRAPDTHPSTEIASEKTSIPAAAPEKSFPEKKFEVPPKPGLPEGPPSQRQDSARVAGPRQMAPDTGHLPPKVTSVSSTTPWVRRYLNARPKDILLPVPHEYIADGFNLAQLAPIVERIGFQVMGTQAVHVAKRLVELPSPQPSYPIYRLALQLLLNENEDEEASILTHPLIPPHAIQQAAEALYLMVHARFVSSPRGLDALRRILLNSPVFGKCPRIQCQGTMLLPYGTSNDFTSNARACQRYCPSCGNLWHCWESKTDGCAWGPSLCYLLLMAHGHELYPMASRRQAQVLSTVVHPNDPRVFGFRIHPAATWGRPLTGS